MTKKPKTERVHFCITIDKDLAEYIEREARSFFVRSKSAAIERVIRGAIRADIELREKWQRAAKRADKNRPPDSGEESGDLSIYYDEEGYAESCED